MTYRDAICIVINRPSIAWQDFNRLARLGPAALADYLLDRLVWLWLYLRLGRRDDRGLGDDRDELDAAGGLMMTEKILNSQIWTQTQYYV